MGCPNTYYKKALQVFAYNLNIFADKSIAITMHKEDSEDVLENEINKWKSQVSLKEFYYNAGRTVEHVLNDAYKNNGCDGFNACIGGLNQFESFIEVSDD